MIQAQIMIAATRHGLEPALVSALVSVESNFNPYALNPEPRYRYLWDVRLRRPFRTLTQEEIASEVPPGDFSCLVGDPDHEWWCQQASWGLMQVMGAVARERGFRGLYLTELVNGAVNLDIGCEHLRSLLTWAREDTTQALAAYNGGKGGNDVRPFRNIAYAEKVLTRMP